MMNEEEIIKLKQSVKSLQERVATLEKFIVQTHTANHKVEAKKVSPKEFLLDRNSASIVSKTLLLGYYLENVRGLGAFNTQDLEAVFREAKEKSPANIHDMINKNIAKGFIMEDKAKKSDKKAWVLTARGEKEVEGAERDD